MDKFLLTDADRAALGRFVKVYSNVDLDTLKPNGELRAYQGKAGVYFWVMRHNGVEHKVYAGKTTNFVFRVQNYCTKFQPGVVNDFKMKFFQNWARKQYPGMELDIYFREVDKASISKAEAEIINATNPFMNKRAKHAKADRDFWFEACELFFQQGFVSRLTSIVETPSLETVLVNAETTAFETIPEATAKKPSKGYEHWSDVVEKQRASYVTKGFKEGSVNAILLPLLERAEGVSLDEAHEALGNRNRRKSTLIGDFSAIMTITGRAKVTRTVGNVKRYFLLVERISRSAEPTAHAGPPVKDRGDSGFSSRRLAQARNVPPDLVPSPSRET